MYFRFGNTFYRNLKSPPEIRIYSTLKVYNRIIDCWKNSLLYLGKWRRKKVTVVQIRIIARLHSLLAWLVLLVLWRFSRNAFLFSSAPDDSSLSSWLSSPRPESIVLQSKVETSEHHQIWAHPPGLECEPSLQPLHSCVDVDAEHCEHEEGNKTWKRTAEHKTLKAIIPVTITQNQQW